MRGGFVLITATTVALALSPAAQGAVNRVDGTVIKRARDAHSFVLVTRTGRMLGIQARRSPRVGRFARLGARRLSTGRYSGRNIRVLGRRQRVRVRGAVSSVAAQRRLFRVSTRGASVLVRTRSARSLPRRGTRVDLRASIDRQGRLWLISMRTQPAAGSPGGGNAGRGGATGSTRNSAEGGSGSAQSGGGSSATSPVARSGFIFMDGVVVEVDDKTRKFRVAPDEDDQGENDPPESDTDETLPRGTSSEPRYGEPVTLVVPRSIDLTRFHVGQIVRLVLRRYSTGELVVEEADPAKKDDGSERDPDDGPDDGEGPDPPLQG
jgi:hypothetical protein